MTNIVKNWYDVKGISKKSIKNDIERGVKTLSERAYCMHHGYSGNSVTFFNKVTRFNIGKITRAEFTYKRGRYLVRLYTQYGFTIVLNGLGFGYYGEGARTAAAIIEACGGTYQQVQKVYTQESNFRLYFR